MPIIEITSLPPAPETDIGSALAHVTDAVATHQRGAEGNAGDLAAGGARAWRGAGRAQPRATHPAIVDEFAGRRDDPGELLLVVGRAVVEAFGLDGGNVVVRLTEATPARVYWGD